jgi:hypothetical protein
MSRKPDIEISTNLSLDFWVKIRENIESFSVFELVLLVEAICKLNV